MNEAYFDAIKRLQEEYLLFPAFKIAVDQMEANLKLYRQIGVAQNLLVLGESGTGKTTLGRVFTNRYPKQRLPERDVIPVLHVTVPAAATIAGTVEAILNQLGDQEPERGTVSVKTARAVRLAMGCGVEMLVFDEAQHIQDRGRSYSQYFVGDWLKSFIDALGLPVTLLGLPRTEILLQVNEQLRRRFAHRLSMALVPEAGKSTEDEMLELFSSLANASPLPLNPSPYSWLELGTRFHYAPHGRIAYVKRLLVAAYSLSMDYGVGSITTDALAHAFTSTVWQQGITALNPFHRDFQFRTLDRAGEPFEMGDTGARANGNRRRSLV